MALKRSRKAPQATSSYDRSKEETIRTLVAALTANGLTVRREDLKRGPGWKAVSGVCRVASQKVVFLDRSTRQDEQIEFLIGRFAQFQLTPTPELLQQLPESVRHLLEARPVSVAA